LNSDDFEEGIKALKKIHNKSAYRKMRDIRLVELFIRADRLDEAYNLLDDTTFYI